MYLCIWVIKRKTAGTWTQSDLLRKCSLPWSIVTQVLVEYKKDINKLEQVWSGTGTLALWGEADGAGLAEPGERRLWGDLNPTLNYLMEENRGKGARLLEAEWGVMDTSWKMGNSDSILGKKIHHKCGQTLEPFSREVEGPLSFKIFKTQLKKSMSSLL